MEVKIGDALLLGMQGERFRQSHIVLFVHRRLSGVKENRRAERNAELKVNLTLYKSTIEYIIIYTCTVLSLLIGGEPACVW
jgi:hypothetical protein